MKCSGPGEPRRYGGCPNYTPTQTKRSWPRSRNWTITRIGPALATGGVWPSQGGAVPGGPLVRASGSSLMVRPFASLAFLLDLLNRWAVPTLVYLDPPDRELQSQLESATLHFQPEPVDMDWPARDAILAILHGGHGATAADAPGRSSRSYKFPLVVEQLLTSVAAIRLGAALVARPPRLTNCRRASSPCCSPRPTYRAHANSPLAMQLSIPRNKWARSSIEVEELLP